MAKVEGSKDGYIARVTRAPDNVTRYSDFVLTKSHLAYHFTSRDCYCASSAMKKNEFIQVINVGFNSGGMFCTLSDSELGHHLLEKVMDFMKNPTK